VVGRRLGARAFEARVPEEGCAGGDSRSFAQRVGAQEDVDCVRVAVGCGARCFLARGGA